MLSCGKVIRQLSRVTRNVNSNHLQRVPKFFVVNARHLSNKNEKSTIGGKSEECTANLAKKSQTAPINNASPSNVHSTTECSSKNPISPMCEEICGKIPPTGGQSNDSTFQKYWKHIFAAVIIAGVTVYALTKTDFMKNKVLTTLSEKKKEQNSKKKSHRVPVDSKYIPSEVPYLLVGGGTAAFSAFRSIKSRDPKAKVLVISEESDYPYMRPPLSKELWFNRDRTPSSELNFKQWNGSQRSLFYEPSVFYTAVENLSLSEKGGVAIASGWKVKKIDAFNKIAYLDDDYEIRYEKCLIATGASPKNIPILEKANDAVKSKVILFRTKDDFLKLEAKLQDPTIKNVVILGGGFLGSELACSLARTLEQMGKRVYQVYKEKFIMSQILPEYLSEWTTEKSKLEGVISISNSEIEDLKAESGKLRLTLTSGKCIEADQIIVAVGVDANTELASTSALEVDPSTGGFLVNAELEARRDLWVAGDAASFYDVRLGRRRVEHHDHAVISGRLAGENMTGAKKPYLHQSMFWSDLGPEVGYEAIGIVDSSLPSVGVFAKSDKTSESEKSSNNSSTSSTSVESAKIVPSGEGKEGSPDEKSTKVKLGNVNEINTNSYGKGIIFYLKENVVVGIILWNIFNRMSTARQVLARGTKYDEINEISKLFSIHED